MATGTACWVLASKPAQSAQLLLVKGAGPGAWDHICVHVLAKAAKQQHSTGQVAVTVRRMASATRRAVGRYSGSNTSGKGVS